jgi:hypothetical protein
MPDGRMHEGWISAMSKDVPAEDWNNEVQPYDAVLHPKHYCRFGIECIDAIKASMEPTAFCGYLKGNCIKYLWRYDLKGDRVENLKKAKVYLEWLINEEGK